MRKRRKNAPKLPCTTDWGWVLFILVLRNKKRPSRRWGSWVASWTSWSQMAGRADGQEEGDGWCSWWLKASFSNTKLTGSDCHQERDRRRLHAQDIDLGTPCCVTYLPSPGLGQADALWRSALLRWWLLPCPPLHLRPGLRRGWRQWHKDLYFAGERKSYIVGSMMIADSRKFLQEACADVTFAVVVLETLRTYRKCDT